MRYEVIVVSCLALLSGAVIPSGWEAPLAPYIPPAVKPLPHLPPRPWVALTFDDGPHAGRTPELLNVLRRAKVPATFFVVGKMAERHPDLVLDIAQQGHELANHTFTHPNLSQLSDDAVLVELKQTRDVIHRLTGQPGYLFRPPGGDFSRRTVRVAAKAGYRIVLWNVLTHDVHGAKPATMRRRILRGADDGAIILMHSGMKNTIEMLPSVIASLRERGYHFVTVSTLLANTSLRKSPQPVLQTASSAKY
jgi:peptidoglycan/xylan/chitin deacetylase (PgdA/CDA1 family)